jgi:hypothetical protein
MDRTPWVCNLGDKSRVFPKSDAALSDQGFQLARGFILRASDGWSNSCGCEVGGESGGFHLRAEAVCEAPVATCVGGRSAEWPG